VGVGGTEPVILYLRLDASKRWNYHAGRFNLAGEGENLATRWK